MIQIGNEIEWFVTGETSRPVRNVSRDFVDNFSNHRQNMPTFPLPHNGKNSSKIPKSRSGGLPKFLDSIGGCSCPSPRPRARRWMENNWRLCRVASAMPYAWYPSRKVHAHWLVPNYTACWQWHTCVNNVSRVALGSGAGQDSNPPCADCKSSIVTTRPPRHIRLSSL